MLDKLPTELLDLLAIDLDSHALRSVVLTAKGLAELYGETLLLKGMENEGFPMIWAAAHGDLELAARILVLDKSQNSQTTGARRRWSRVYEEALQTAAGHGQSEMVTLLLQRLPDLDLNSVVDDYERSPLWSAAVGGHVAVLRALAACDGTDLDGKDCVGQTALRMAVECHHPEAVRVLLELGADPRVADADQVTPAMAAAGKGHADLLHMLAAHDRDLCLAADSQGFTPLLAAATHGHVEAVRALAAHGADLCAAWAGLTPLARAVHADAPDLIDFLLGHPAVAKELHAYGTDGTTLLMAAVRRGCTPTTARALLRGGADPNGRRSTGTSTLTYALRAMEWSLTASGLGGGDDDETTTVAELLCAGADPNRRERPADIYDAYRGSTALAEPAAKGQWQVVDHLISLGDVVDWHAGVHMDTAPLACAVRNGHLRVAQSLVSAGVSPNVTYTLDEDQLENLAWEQDRRIRTRATGPAAFIALHRGDLDMFRWLLGSGKVDLAATNANGRTLVQMALQEGQRAMLNALREVGCVPTESEVARFGDDELL
ncbi:hypothetical protein PWT90_10109 [Aphanocladium album]|nr:hypothetical protein PWT90_10109 [Aphanocladium album]